MIVFDKDQWVKPENIEAIAVEFISGYPNVVLYMSGGHTLKSKQVDFDQAHRKADSFAISISSMLDK